MFKVQCKNCNHENEISKENKKNYDISEISYISITKLFPKLLCSNCRQKNV